MRQLSVMLTTASISDSTLHPTPFPSNFLILVLIHFLPFLLFSLEEICAELVSAIEAGDVRVASVCASSLAKQRAALSIQPSKHNYTDTEIR